MADRSWFFASQGKQLGPYPETQLRDFISKGVVTAETLVWTDSMADWQRAADIPGFLPGLQPEAAPALHEGAALPLADRDFSGPETTRTEKIQGLEISLGRLMRIYWLFVWRSALGSLLIGFVVGFIVGLAMAALGGKPEQIKLVGGMIGVGVGAIWSCVVLRMALKKNYSDFRIVLVPRDAELN